MELTLEDKLRILNETYNFPCRIAFYLTVDTKGKYGMIFREVRNRKGKIENIKFNELSLFSLGGESMTPLSVMEVNSAMEIIDEADGLGRIWLGEGESDENL